MRIQTLQGYFYLMVISGLLLTGCSFERSVDNKSTTQSKNATVQSTTAEPMETKEEKSPLIKNDTGKTIISKANTDLMYNTTYMIISKNGTVVLADPIQVLEKIKADIITVTHSHSDHYDGSAKENDNCKKSMSKVESFTHKDVKVTSVASSHGNYEVNKTLPDNVIYIFEVDGLRIAHMGDIGQNQLTDEQIKEIGKLDVAFMPCIDLPQYGLTMDNSMKIIEQIKPQIVIPTHFDPSNFEKVSKLEKTFDETDFKFELCKEDLNDGKRKFIRLN